MPGSLASREMEMASLGASGQVEACALVHVAAPVRFSTLTPEAASAFVGRQPPPSQAPGCQRPASTKLTKDVSSVEDSTRRDLNLEFSNGRCCCSGGKGLPELLRCGAARRVTTGLRGRPRPGAGGIRRDSGPREPRGLGGPLSRVSLSTADRGHSPCPMEGLSGRSAGCGRTSAFSTVLLPHLFEGNRANCKGEARGLEARRGGSEKKNIY